MQLDCLRSAISCVFLQSENWRWTWRVQLTNFSFSLQFWLPHLENASRAWSISGKSAGWLPWTIWWHSAVGWMSMSVMEIEIKSMMLVGMSSLKHLHKPDFLERAEHQWQRKWLMRSSTVGSSASRGAGSTTVGRACLAMLDGEISESRKCLLWHLNSVTQSHCDC